MSLKRLKPKNFDLWLFKSKTAYGQEYAKTWILTENGGWAIFMVEGDAVAKFRKDGVIQDDYPRPVLKMVLRALPSSKKSRSSSLS